jgi:spermidine/putrescine transport system substrate-binding protein
MSRYEKGTPPPSLPRRDFTRLLAAAGLSMVALPVLSRRTSAAENVNFYTWSGYEVPELQKAYIDKYGAPSQTTFFGSQDEALQKILGGFNADISHPCNSNLQRWREAGILQPVEVERLKNWPDLWKPLRDLSTGITEGKHWFVPFDWGTASVLYRPDLVDIKEESWSLLFDERYKGRLSTYDSLEGGVTTAEIVAGVKDPFNPTDEEIARTGELLRKQRDLLRFYWSDPTTIEQGLASGELVAAYAWPSSAFNLQKQGVQIKYMTPKEGILTWVCGFVMIKNGPADAERKYDLLDALISPESGRYLIEQLATGHANSNAFAMVDKTTLANLGLSEPETYLENGIFFQPMDEAKRQQLLDVFEKVKAGG